MATKNRNGSLLTLETLKKKRDFDRLYECGRKVWNHAYVVYVGASPSGVAPGTCRYGVTASRRVGDSVRRNRARRLVREALRLSKERLRPGLDIVVVVRSSANGLKCQEVQRLLLQLLARCEALVPEKRPPKYAKRNDPPELPCISLIPAEESR